MQTQIFVNLPIKDLKKSMDFFWKLGYTFNPQFTDEKATCMIISDTIFVMLVVEDYFKTFIIKEIADASKVTESMIALSMESKQKVDEMLAKAVEAWATIPKKVNDYGFMYEWTFQDLDWHLWNPFWMDPANIK